MEDRVDEARQAPTPVAVAGRWMFVPIPVVNPTVGNGAQLAVLYMHPKAAGQESAPSSTSGVVAMATDGGARMLGAFHDGSFANDRYRIRAFAGRGDFELEFYGIGSGQVPGGGAISYEMNGTVAQLRGEARLPGTQRWFAGLTYQYLQSSLTVLSAQSVPELPQFPIRFHDAAIGPHVTFDSRDSNYFPTRGQHFQASWLDYSPRWGGDKSFGKGNAFYNHYLPLGMQSVLGLRARLQAASADTPFYELPTLEMRGFSRDRYRDNYTLSVTSEWRHKFTQRWGMVAFAEAGRFASKPGGLSDGRTIVSYGSGVRWQVAADRDMHIGVDAAISTDDRAVFVQIGEKF